MAGPNKTRSVTINQILTTAQIERAMELYNEHYGKLNIEDKRSYADKVCAEIIEPNIAEISRKAGQEMVPKYVAYLIEYVFTQYGRRKK